MVSFLQLQPRAGGGKEGQATMPLEDTTRFKPENFEIRLGGNYALI